MNFWPWNRREVPNSDDSEHALAASKIRADMATDIYNRAVSVADDLNKTLDRNHFAESIAKSMTRKA